MNLIDIYDNWSLTLEKFDNDTLLYLYFAFRNGSMAQILVYKELIVRGVQVYE